MTQNWIYPEQDGALEFRKALGSFATGVTVVAAWAEDGREVRAFTANSFTSVSLDPALVLVCLAKSSPSLNVFREAPHFSINVLSAGQREMSNAFASRDPEVKKAAAAKMLSGDAPYIGGSLTSFICSMHEVVDAGDHLILIGRVRKLATADGQPLGFFRGSYVGIGPGLSELEKLGSPVILGGLGGRDGKVLLCRKPGQNDWEIPSVTLPHGARFERALEKCFADLGVCVHRFVPYSLFQETGEAPTSLFFTAELSDETPPPPAGGVETAWFGQDDAPWTLVKGEMKQWMLKRYLREAATGLFGVYFDSLDGGNVMAFEGAPRTWSDWDKQTSEGAAQQPQSTEKAD